MSVEIRITKELGDYEPKLISSFTARQTFCLAAGGILCYMIYRGLSPYVPRDVCGFLCFIPGTLACIFGWVKPYGMKPEKFLKTYLINTLLAPNHRPYRSENCHEKIYRLLEKAERDEAEEQLRAEQAKRGRHRIKTKKKKKEPTYTASPLSMK